MPSASDTTGVNIDMTDAYKPEAATTSNNTPHRTSTANTPSPSVGHTPVDADSKYVPLPERPYDPQFENELAALVLHGKMPSPSLDQSTPVAGAPLPLSSTSRNPENVLHPTIPIPLTHEHGSPYGGPGPKSAAEDKEQLAFTANFLKAHPNIRTKAGLKKAQEKEIEKRIKSLIAIAETREAMRLKNEQIDKDITQKTAEHAMETNIRLAEMKKKAK